MSADQRPWFREFWVWVVIALPLSAVVAGISTVIIASSGNDALVVDDFRKVGLVARRETAREQEATRLAISMMASLDRATGQVIVRLDSHAAELAPPTTLRFALFHPTLRDRDVETTLARDAAGVYRGSLGTRVDGHWHVQVSDAAGTWRVTDRVAGDVTLFRIGSGS